MAFATIEWPAATVLCVAILAICLITIATIGRRR